MKRKKNPKNTKKTYTPKDCKRDLNQLCKEGKAIKLKVDGRNLYTSIESDLTQTKVDGKLIYKMKNGDYTTNIDKLLDTYEN